MDVREILAWQNNRYFFSSSGWIRKKKSQEWVKKEIKEKGRRKELGEKMMALVWNLIYWQDIMLSCVVAYWKCEAGILLYIWKL